MEGYIYTCNNTSVVIIIRKNVNICKNKHSQLLQSLKQWQRPVDQGTGVERKLTAGGGAGVGIGGLY